jgi:hypothetical protein
MHDRGMRRGSRRSMLARSRRRSGRSMLSRSLRFIF